MITRGYRAFCLGVEFGQPHPRLQLLRRGRERRRHRAARAAPARPEIDHHRQIAARDMPIETGRCQFDRLVLEQRLATGATARVLFDAIARHAVERAIAGAGDDEGFGHPRLLCTSYALAGPTRQPAKYTRSLHLKKARRLHVALDEEGCRGGGEELAAGGLQRRFRCRDIARAVDDPSFGDQILVTRQRAQHLHAEIDRRIEYPGAPASCAPHSRSPNQAPSRQSRHGRRRAD